MKLVMEVEDQGTISFKRSIIPNRSSDGFTSSYAIDEQTVTWTKYEEKLKSFGILVKARNFLVFQVSGSQQINAHSCSLLMQQMLAHT